MDTNIPYGDPRAVKIQSAGLFAANQHRHTTINRLTGAMPTQSKAEIAIKARNQSSNQMPIVRSEDLTKTAGDEIQFDLIQIVGGKPIMGSEYAEGKGEPMEFDSDKLRIDQSRKPISAGGKMTQQRTKHDLRKMARAQGQGYMDRLTDQLPLVHMAGARGFANDITWCVPLASDPDFSKICVNPVKAPTYNRHFISTGSGMEHVSATGNEINIATTDVANLELVDAVRTKVDGMPLPPPPVHFPNDVMAADSPLRVYMCSSEQYTSVVQSGNFRTLQASAYQRASLAGNHPLLMGDAGLWNGILVIKMPKPIRFFAGDSLKWCPSATSTTETATDLVPASFGSTYAVDRSILLGGQAVALAFGKTRKTGNPFFWSEKELDHGDKLEVLVGMISGCSKIQFLVDQGPQKEYTDHGIMVIDTAVKISQ